MGSEDMEMAGGASQRVDIGLNSLSGRSVTSDQYSRNMAVAKRADPVTKVRPVDGFGEYSDPQKFLGRERQAFINAERDYRDANEGFHLEHRIQKDNGGDADERKNLYLGSQMTGLGVGRDQDWGSGERGVGPDADYRDIGVVRENEVSQSEGTEEEDEDDGDMEGDGDGGGLGERGREMVLAERNIQHSQLTSMEARSRQDSMVPSSRGLDGFQRPVSDRDRGMKVPTSTSQPFGLYLQPQGTGLSFLNYGTTSPSGGQMATHVEANAAQNGGVGPGGVGPGMPGPYGMREGGISRDTYAKGLAARENSLSSSLHEHQSQGHLHDSLQSSEENYYTSLLNSTGSTNNAQKGHDLGNDVGAACLKRNSRMLDSPSTAEPSLRRILSDPFSGQLMEDATIFACGHSFGNTGLEQVLATSACHTCGASVRNTSMAANYALRAAVQAFKREEENSALNKSVKRRRDRSEQDHGTPSEQQPSSDNRSKGVQFPFAVSDRVLIKGNKRTPERFVGREAIITNQCLNGWYLVRTLDNGESVRLQYRSLQKVGGQPSPSASHFAPGWL